MKLAAEKSLWLWVKNLLQCSSGGKMYFSCISCVEISIKHPNYFMSVMFVILSNWLKPTSGIILKEGTTSIIGENNKTLIFLFPWVRRAQLTDNFHTTTLQVTWCVQWPASSLYILHNCKTSQSSLSKMLTCTTLTEDAFKVWKR